MKVLISTPAYQHQVNNEMVDSLLRTVQYMRDHNHAVNWHSPTSSVLTYNRNMSVDLAIKDHYDWLLFWDGDVSVKEPEFIEKMAELGHKTTADIIGLPVVLKGEPKTYNCASMFDGSYINHQTVPANPWNVDVIGTGVMLIWVNLFKKMQLPAFHFVDTYAHGKSGFFPEDWTFCEDAMPYTKVIADPRFTVEHWGLKPFS